MRLCWALAIRAEGYAGFQDSKPSTSSWSTGTTEGLPTVASVVGAILLARAAAGAENCRRRNASGLTAS